MPKNKGKGGKNRRRGKNESEEKRELILKELGQEYGQVLRMLGHGRIDAYCFDGKKRLCHIRGKMRKREWVNQGDIVLLGLREYQDDKADVIRKYNSDETRRLKKMGELPKDVKTDDEGGHRSDDDMPFDFSGDRADVEAEDVGDQPIYGDLPDYDDYSEEEESEDDEINLDEL